MSRRRKTGTPQKSPANEVKAQRMLSQLRKQYAIGKEALATKRPAAELAEMHGLSRFTIYKLLEFAKAYSARDLEQFCKLRRPNGLPLHWGHVIYLLVAHNRGKSQRQRLERQAAKQGWTAPQLYAAIRKSEHQRLGDRQGRKISLHENLETVTRQLINEIRLWCRRCEQFATKLLARGSKRLPQTILAELRECVEKVSGTFRPIARTLTRSTRRKR